MSPAVLVVMLTLLPGNQPVTTDLYLPTLHRGGVREGTMGDVQAPHRVQPFSPHDSARVHTSG